MPITQPTSKTEKTRTFVSLRLKILVGFTLIFSAVFPGLFTGFSTLPQIRH